MIVQLTKPVQMRFYAEPEVEATYKNLKDDDESDEEVGESAPRQRPGPNLLSDLAACQSAAKEGQQKACNAPRVLIDLSSAALEAHMAAIRKQREVEEEGQMQIDGGRIEDQSAVVTTRELAERIFADLYPDLCARSDKFPALDEFKKSESKYYNDTICALEARILICQTVKDKASLAQVLKCGLISMKRLIQREDSFPGFGTRFSSITSERAQRLLGKQFVKRSV